MRPGACIVAMLGLRSRVGVETGGKPYCCIPADCPGGVGIGGTSDDADGPGSAVYVRPREGKKGDRLASIVSCAPLPMLVTRGDLGVKIRRGLGKVEL